MLLNNFIPLIDFYPDSDFVDVGGNTIHRYDIMPGNAGSEPRNDNVTTGIHCFNYNATVAANAFTDEQEFYNWYDTVGAPGLYANTRIDRNQRACGFTLFAGTGNTAVQASDYCLDNFIELEVIDSACYHYDDHRTETKRTFRNNTANSVTINELGLYMFAQQGSQYGTGDGTNYPVIMIGRKVLTSPITLAVGDIYTFSYIINMSNVTFTEAAG